MIDLEPIPNVGGPTSARPNPVRTAEDRVASCSCREGWPECATNTQWNPEQDARVPEASAVVQGTHAATDTPTPIAMSDLIDRIVRVHHGRLRRELPRLLKLADDVADAYGCQNPVLGEVRAVLGALKEDLDAHMVKEEWFVFPKLIKWESARAGSCCLDAPDGSFEPLEIEHQRASATLARLRALTHGVSARLQGCAMYQVLMEGLATLESDLEQHVHDEHDQLFPQACVTAALLRARLAAEAIVPVDPGEPAVVDSVVPR